MAGNRRSLFSVIWCGAAALRLADHRWRFLLEAAYLHPNESLRFDSANAFQLQCVSGTAPFTVHRRTRYWFRLEWRSGGQLVSTRRWRRNEWELHKSIIQLNLWAEWTSLLGYCRFHSIFHSICVVFAGVVARVGDVVYYFICVCVTA